MFVGLSGPGSVVCLSWPARPKLVVACGGLGVGLGFPGPEAAGMA